MSTLSFPSAPSLNDTYSFDGKTWVWNGSAWDLQDQGAINGIVIGNVTPAAGSFTTLSATGNITGDNILGNGASLSGINAFSTILVTGSQTVSAGNIAGSFTLVGSDGVTITANNTTNIITFTAATAGESIFATGGDMELVTEAVTSSEDLGNVIDAVTQSYSLGTLAVDGIVTNQNIVDGSLTGNKFAPDTDLATTGNLTVGNLSVTGAIEFDTVSANGLSGPTGNILITGNLIPAANVTYDLGNTTNRWNELYLAGSSLYIGNVILKNTEGNTVEFFGADGTTPAAISSQNIQIDSASISNGNSSMSIASEDGNIVANVAGVEVATFISGGISTNRNITANTTVGNVNAMAVGPVIIDDGVTVTISSGGEWSII